MAPVADDPMTLADSSSQAAPARTATVVSAAKRQEGSRLNIPLQPRDDVATDPKLLQRMELLRKEVSESSHGARRARMLASEPTQVYTMWCVLLTGS